MPLPHRPIGRVAAPALLLAGCVAVPPPPPATANAAAFPTLAFFDGGTEGQGRLRIALKGVHDVRVHGVGAIEPDGSLRLDQTVEEAGKPPRHRRWRIRETAPGRYAGTLSDAAGPVTAEATPGKLHIAFAMKGGLRAEQWLTLAPDRRSAANLMIVRAHGLPIARLEETIRRDAPLP